MIKDSTLYIGGNRLLVKIGKCLRNKGENIIRNNKSIKVTNPNCRLVNPFTLIVNFTVDDIDKYQIVLQGDYKEKYRESEVIESSIRIPNVEENHLFSIISANSNSWFKKE